MIESDPNCPESADNLIEGTIREEAGARWDTSNS